MVKSKREKTHRSEEFKLSVLKDMYEHGLSYYATAKKYDIAQNTVAKWEKHYPVDSTSLSLSDEVISQVKAMKVNGNKSSESSSLSHEEQLSQEVETLRKALAYSELRNEALHEVLKIAKDRYGIDLLKKAGAKQ